MTNTRSTKRALLASLISMLLCFTMLLGTTYAWFTDSVTSSGNKIVAGSLKVDLEVLENNSWVSVKDDPRAIFTYDKWEPGYTEVKFLKVVNKGTLALKWKAALVTGEDIGILADVIDVYVKEYDGSETPEVPATRDLTAEGWTKLNGTLRDFIDNIEMTTNGELKAGESEVLGIAFRMQETADNNYQDQKLGAFDIKIFAAQLGSESDSFDNKYDNDAVYDDGEIILEGQPWHELDAIKVDTVIDGGGYTYANEYQEICLSGDADVTIKGVTFKNGLTIFNNGDVSGTVTLENCTIYLNNGEGNEVNSTFSQNHADYGLYIGALDKDVTYVFKNCTFTAYSNHTYTDPTNSSYNVYIGGNYSADNITFDGCTFNGSGKNGLGCPYAYSTDENNPFTYYNLTVTNCRFTDWNNNNQNGAAIRGNVPADVLTAYGKTINISGNVYGNGNGTNKTSVAIDGWNGSWS